jgi:hypothetical protein
MSLAMPPPHDMSCAAEMRGLALRVRVRYDHLLLHSVTPRALPVKD